MDASDVPTASWLKDVPFVDKEYTEVLPSSVVRNDLIAVSDSLIYTDTSTRVTVHAYVRVFFLCVCASYTP